MAQETTTTYTVTVKYKGPKKDFGLLFRQTGRVLDYTGAVVSSESKKTTVNAKYSDEQKIAREFIKQACESAGLKYGNFYENTGFYELNYSYRTRKKGQTQFQVLFHYAYVKIDFEHGVDQQGGVSVYKRVDTETPSFPDESSTINLADPNAKELLISIFKTWGH